MRTHRAKGFTLVEILIVVVILGILAAIVVPQFTSASQDAVKGALKSQIQTLTAQTELYRVQNFGRLPHQAVAPDQPLVAGPGQDDGATWGVLVLDQFLKGEPVNGYTASSSVVFDGGAVGDAVIGMLAAGTAPAAQGASTGWIYNDVLGSWQANGFNANTNRLSIETDANDPPVYAIPNW